MAVIPILRNQKMRYKFTGQAFNAIIFAIAVLLSIILSTCDKNKQTLSPDISRTDTTLGMLIADTITYEVVIVNPDTSDIYKQQFLGRLNHKAFLDSIFNLVLSGRLPAFEYGTNKTLSPRDIERIEKKEGYSRANIGMIQFSEIWYLNCSTGKMTKKVHSLIPGYSYYSQDSLILGYTPLFMVKLN